MQSLWFWVSKSNLSKNFLEKFAIDINIPMSFPLTQELWTNHSIKIRFLYNSLFLKNTQKNLPNQNHPWFFLVDKIIKLPTFDPNPFYYLFILSVFFLILLALLQHPSPTYTDKHPIWETGNKSMLKSFPQSV